MRQRSFSSNRRYKIGEKFSGSLECGMPEQDWIVTDCEQRDGVYIVWVKLYGH